MAADAAPSSLRSIFEKFVAEAEVACAESRTRARYDIAEQLNQAVRRLRHAPSPDELSATLTDVASAFTGGLALFRIDAGRASSSDHHLDLPLADTPAFQSALDSGDPVVAASTPGEVTAEVPEKLGHPAGDRVWLFPVKAGARPAAVLYCWGDVAVPVVELYAQVASGAWAALAAPEPSPSLVTISAPSAPPAPSLAVEAPPPPAKRAFTWDDLPSGEQQIHLRAQRFARVHASTMRLNQPGAVQAGRIHRNLYEMLRSPIDEARATYRKDFFDQCGSMVDYLHLELVHTLANDDAELLGSQYPGPLV